MAAPNPYQKLLDLPPHVRGPALEMLDQFTTPLSPRELDRAIRNQGFTRAQAKAVTLVLKRLQVVALVGR